MKYYFFFSLITDKLWIESKEVMRNYFVSFIVRKQCEVWIGMKGEGDDRADIDEEVQLNSCVTRKN